MPSISPPDLAYSTLVDHPDHVMVADIVVIHIGGRVIGQDGQALLHQRHIRWRIVDQEIDVLGKAAGAMRQNGEAADQ